MHDIDAWWKSGQHTRLVIPITDEKEAGEIKEIAGKISDKIKTRDFSDEWEIYPEERQIIIGSHIELLSSALNRGYKTEKTKWPIRFGMLHNDVEWTASDSLLDGFYAYHDKFDSYNAKFPKSEIKLDIDIDKLFNIEDGDYQDIIELTENYDYIPAEKPVNKNDTPIWITLAKHSSDIVNVFNQLAFARILDTQAYESTKIAARFHDWGKAHKKFKDAFFVDLTDDEIKERQNIAWAKRRPRITTNPDYFHDLVGGCGLMQLGLYLPGYLVLTHHGRFRTSLPDDNNIYYIPKTDFGNSVYLDEITISIKQYSEFQKLYDYLGPFKLAYLEGLVRISDIRVSREETGEEDE